MPPKSSSLIKQVNFAISTVVIMLLIIGGVFYFFEKEKANSEFTISHYHLSSIATSSEIKKSLFQIKELILNPDGLISRSSDYNSTLYLAREKLSHLQNIQGEFKFPEFAFLLDTIDKRIKYLATSSIDQDIFSRDPLRNTISALILDLDKFDRLHHVVSNESSKYIERLKSKVHPVLLVFLIIFILAGGFFVKRSLYLIRKIIAAMSEAQEKTRKSEEQLRNITDNTSSVIFLKNLQGKYLFINKQFEKIFQMSRKQILGKTDHELFSKKIADGFVVNDQKVLESISTLEFEEHIDMRDGMHTSIVVKFPLLDSNGHPYALCGIATDITERKKTENLLIRFGRILDNSFSEIFTFNAETFKFTQVSVGACKNLKYSFEELTHLTPLDLKPEYTKDTFEELIKPLREKQEPMVVFETVHKRKDGTLYPVSIRLQLMHNENPSVFVAIVDDITERKKSEEELDCQRCELAQAQEIAHLGSWTWDVQLNNLSWSDEVYRIFGLKPQEFRATYEAFLDCVHPDDQELVDLAVRESFENKTPYNIEHRIIRPDGEERIVHEQSENFYDEDGRPLRMIGIVQDITERKESEEELKRHQSELAQAQEIARLGSWTWDVQLSNLSWSDEMYRILGLEPQETEATYETFLDKIHPKDRDIFLNTNRESILGKQSYNFKHRILLPNGDVKYVHQISKTQYDDKGYPLKVVGAINDITTIKLGELARLKIEKELETSRERLRELNNKLQSVREEEKLHLAREIHDELGQVITYCKLDLLWIKKEIKNPGEKIDKKFESMVSHLDDTLEKVRSISSELRPGILDTLGISEALKWQVQKFTDQTNIKCDIDIVPEKFECERDLSIDLFRIFQETLTNISRHAQATSVQVKFFQDEKYYRLIVKDNGKGFDNKLQIHSRSLGILGMKERALSWCGQVDIQGKPGIGTTVTVILPIKDNYDL